MSRLLEIHPTHPEKRLIRQAADVLRAGGLIVYPTDSCYALGFHIGDKAPIREIRRIRQTDKAHNFTLVCSDLSEIATYARVDNWHYRMLKAHTPGPYTFILQASRSVPRRLQNERRKTIGIRVPDHPVPQALIAELGEPDPEEMLRRLKHDVELVIDSGSCGIEPTTVVDMTGEYPVVLRAGKGASEDFA